MSDLWAPQRDARRRAVEPLAVRLRPRTLDEVAGQRHILGPGKLLRRMIDADRLTSVIFCGPPGTGKTTLAEVIARHTQAHFERANAASVGVKEIREILEGAVKRLETDQKRTILFLDEIHRFARNQQDVLLEHVERGLITLIGATTENPSFALTGALLSRCRVYVLEPLAAAELSGLLARALADRDRGLGALELTAEPGVLDLLAGEVSGDARRALTVLEAAAQAAGQGGTLTAALVQDAIARRLPVHDRAGESHFNLLSAYHKALRGSDPQGALYWMARAIEGGEDPLVLFRRAIAMAAEDIGLADPRALQLAVAARDAFQMLGAPEGYLPLAELTIYLATAPKSNSTVVALGAALEAAGRTGDAPVPLHARNAPTSLLMDLGYGEGYRYAHDFADHFGGQSFLPAALEGREFYQPGGLGFERVIAERLAWWRARSRGEVAGAAPPERSPGTE